MGGFGRVESGVALRIRGIDSMSKVLKKEGKAETN